MTAGKKTALGILILLLAGTGFLLIKWLLAKKSDPEATFIVPRLEMTTLQITGLSRERTDMLMGMKINNPSPFGVKIDSMQYKFFIEDVEVMSSLYPETIDLNALDSNVILLPLLVRSEDLINTLKKYENAHVDSVHYRLESTMYFDLPFLRNKPRQIKIEKYLPLFILPKIIIEDIKLSDVSLDNTLVSTTITITNPNNFAFSFKNIYYKFSIREEPVSFGAVNDTISIGAMDSETITLPLKVQLKEVASNIPALFFNKDDTPYSFYCDLVIVADQKSIRESKVVIMSEGNLKDITDLRK